jgi:hypothetical protein
LTRQKKGRRLIVEGGRGGGGGGGGRGGVLQWCQSNFSSIEDFKNRRNRGDFRQKIESMEEMQQFHAPMKRSFLG